jgi:hypothetical protein
VPAHAAHSSATYVIDPICQLRYANKKWGTPLSWKGREWLARQQGTHCAATPAATPAATATPATVPVFGMPNPAPFPNPWGGPLAGQGIIIPPGMAQLALGGPSGTGTMGAGLGFGALAGNPTSAFQLGMQFSTMQQHCLQLGQRMDMMQASTMQDSSKPTCDSDTALKQEGLLT